jgi:hypothetical protein
VLAEALLWSFLAIVAILLVRDLLRRRPIRHDEPSAEMRT